MVCIIDAYKQLGRGGATAVMHFSLTVGFVASLFLYSTKQHAHRAPQVRHACAEGDLAAHRQQPRRGGHIRCVLPADEVQVFPGCKVAAPARQRLREGCSRTNLKKERKQADELRQAGSRSEA
jgi:hypothetical protein